MSNVSWKLKAKLGMQKGMEYVQNNFPGKGCAFCLGLANGGVVMDFYSEDEEKKYIGTFMLPLCMLCTRLGRDVVERRIANEIKQGIVHKVEKETS